MIIRFAKLAAGLFFVFCLAMLCSRIADAIIPPRTITLILGGKSHTVSEVTWLPTQFTYIENGVLHMLRPANFNWTDNTCKTMNDEIFASKFGG